ncbi:hypothetical protein Vadar_027925 [Vaccinium darrowii]|uniref:Uncharacterized protein n=1 Tax=Vaccinium darrowii TaxID=229202 RepID=A0ACB7YZS8_9ERIC|nr:hypothetical protein Vadar_027925 [Vaccinium darrowii]
MYETVSANDSVTYIANGLLEQINVTRDSSDYLWYLPELIQVPSKCSCASANIAGVHSLIEEQNPLFLPTSQKPQTVSLFSPLKTIGFAAVAATTVFFAHFNLDKPHVVRIPSLVAEFCYRGGVIRCNGRGHGPGMGALIAGGAAAAATAYGAHQLSHGAHHHGHGVFYGHHHGKFKHGKFKHGDSQKLKNVLRGDETSFWAANGVVQSGKTWEARPPEWLGSSMKGTQLRPRLGIADTYFD